MEPSKDLRIYEQGGVGTILLDRPKALNALSLTMIRQMQTWLEHWIEDDGIKAIVVKGGCEKAFCAGGDVRGVYEAGLEGDRLTEDFFRQEYKLNRTIHTCPKPYIALINGICMGGGVGISAHGTYQVVGPKTRWAMPETAIGFFPDVGTSYTLSRLPGQLGLFIALTGEQLSGADCLYAGLATHFMKQASQDSFEDRLLGVNFNDDSEDQISSILDDHCEEADTSKLEEKRNRIDSAYDAKSVEAILANLQSMDGEWASEQTKTLRQKSPLSLKVTLEELHRARTLSFDECLKMEFRLSQAFMQGEDFYEGIRAVLVDKDKDPKWKHERVEDVTMAEVQAFFDFKSPAMLEW